MAEFIQVPPERLPADVLRALLEEYASRDGTDYGEQEMSLERKVASLLLQLQRRELQILFDNDSEQWDLLEREQAAALLRS